MDAVGMVLSTRTPLTTELVELPLRSVAIARRSYRPSASAVVSQAAGVSLQVSCPAGEVWYVVDAMPEPASLEVALRVTVPWTFAPGSASVTVGFELSTRRSETTAEVVTLPALSVATARKS